MVALSKWTRKSFLAGCAASALVLGMGSALANTELSSKELRIGTTQEFENLNPLIANMVVSTYALAAVDRGELVVLNENNQWVPQSAERIPTLENGDVVKFTDNGVEKMKVTWRIKKAAVWGDGTPLTGKDFKFAWDIALSDKVSIPSKEPFQIVEKIDIDANDPKVFTFTYNTLRWDYFKNVWRPVPQHIEEAVFKKFGDQVEGYDRNSVYSTAPTTPGLYSGPYRVSEIKLGSHIELVRNEKWWGDTKPSIEKVLIRVIPNSGTLESNLVSGNIDMIMNVGMSLDQALQFEERVAKEKLPFKVDYVDGLVYEHIDLNLDNPLLKDARTRQALLYAIDREALTKALFKGKQKVAKHFVHPTDPWYVEDKGTIEDYEFSPRKARRLLAAVGFQKGKDGILELNGQPFKLSFMTTAGNKIRENVQVFIKNQLAQVGIAVEIKNEPAKVFFGETTSKRKFDGMAMYAWVSSPESDPSQGYHSASIPSEKNGWSGTNYMGWKNAKVDEAITTLNKSFELKDRQEQAKVILSEFTKDLPALPLYYRAQVTILPVGLAGVKPTSTQFSEMYHVEQWKVTSDMMSKK